MFTQASQLRIAQRPTDGGIRIVPAVAIEASNAGAPDMWSDVSEWFEVVGNTLTSHGGVVDFRFAATRINLAGDSIYRLVFTEREDTITTPQVVGEMAIIMTNGNDHTWATYPIAGTTDGTLEPIQPYDKNWPTQTVGDVLQFTGTWFI